MCGTTRASTIRCVIIWLNGTYGAGKTAAAGRLAPLVPGGRLFDPETVGAMLRDNLADRPVGDFQDWSAWPPLVAAALAEVAKMTGQHIIAPQAVLKKTNLDQIFAGLRAAEMEVFHVVLDAPDSVLFSRIESSDEATTWRLARLEEYREARSWLVEAADLVVDTAGTTPSQIARQIRAALPDLPAFSATAMPVLTNPSSAAPPKDSTSEDSVADDAESADAESSDEAELAERR
jgi:chloramphenicol 3-O-phosphotransferase